MTETVTRQARKTEGGVGLGDGLAPTLDPEVAVVRARTVTPDLRRRLLSGDLAIRAASVIAVLAIWEFFGPSLNRLILRPPSQIVAAFFDLLGNGELQVALVQSVRMMAIGFSIALVAGLFIGIASGRWRILFNVLDPWVSALYSVPAVALVPLIAVAFRYEGELPHIATIALFAIFPILINTQQGVRNIDPGLMEVARAFNTSERRLWLDVIVPSAMPFILAGVRLAIGRALIGMIVAQFLISLLGLGYLIVVYQNTFRIDKMFVPVIVVSALGVVLMGLVQFVEGRVAPWLRREQ
ncbi:MAG TPA: ABC transporter permease [Candidatus Limnocylindria bacterium]|jgi:NitT/TauT family transport system permease protein|nr:ABC transporter permease [Candidatus Limnocylindria bacterium]